MHYHISMILSTTSLKLLSSSLLSWQLSQKELLTDSRLNWVRLWSPLEKESSWDYLRAMGLKQHWKDCCICRYSTSLSIVNSCRFFSQPSISLLTFGSISPLAPAHCPMKESISWARSATLAEGEILKLMDIMRSGSLFLWLMRWRPSQMKYNQKYSPNRLVSAPNLSVSAARKQREQRQADFQMKHLRKERRALAYWQRGRISYYSRGFCLEGQKRVFEPSKREQKSQQMVQVVLPSSSSELISCCRDKFLTTKPISCISSTLVSLEKEASIGTNKLQHSTMGNCSNFLSSSTSLVKLISSLRTPSSVFTHLISSSSKLTTVRLLFGLSRSVSLKNSLTISCTYSRSPLKLEVQAATREELLKVTDSSRLMQPCSPQRRRVQKRRRRMPRSQT